jgi:hypothetical protein
MEDRVPKIIDLFKDSDPDVSLAAAKAFGQLAKHGQRLIITRWPVINENSQIGVVVPSKKGLYRRWICSSTRNHIFVRRQRPPFGIWFSKVGALFWTYLCITLHLLNLHFIRGISYRIHRS